MEYLVTNPFFFFMWHWCIIQVWGCDLLNYYIENLIVNSIISAQPLSSYSNPWKMSTSVCNSMVWNCSVNIWTECILFSLNLVSQNTFFFFSFSSLVLKPQWHCDSTMTVQAIFKMNNGMETDFNAQLQEQWYCHMH